MANCFFDIETKSGLDLPTVGSTKYFGDRQADLICLAFNVNKTKTELWIPGMPVPEIFRNPIEHTYYALNIQFDQYGINTVGTRHGYPKIHLDNCIDVMALLAHYTLPQNLDMAGKVLDVPIKKLKSGVALKKKICVPPFQCTKAELHEFYKYCMYDVASMVEIVKALPSEKLSISEQNIWRVTVDINRRGVPIDIKTAARVDATVDYYMKKRIAALPILTKGADPVITRPTQVKRIREWLLNDHDIETDNLNKETVEELLRGSHDLPYEVEEVLLIRQDVGGAAVKKYKRLINQTYYGRIYNNLRYGAASTLRFGGLGFQVHNLPRDSVFHPEYAIKMFESGAILARAYWEQNPKDPDEKPKAHSLMECAKALIRPCIKAKEGHELMAGDFGSVEAVYLMWMADETAVLRRLAEGFDMYKDMASSLYEIPYDQINYQQRFLGKTLVLGAGYNLGWLGFIEYARAFGLSITEEMAQRAINKYREKHPEVVKMWYGFKNCAINAVKNPRVPFKYKRFTFIVNFDRNGNKWLMMKLPSGRSLYYCKPFIKQGRFGDEVAHYGINSTTKQWTVKSLIPGRITENADQALSRDRMCFSIDRLIEYDYTPIFHVHDEVVNEVPIGKYSLEHMLDLMRINPRWCPTLPLNADGYVSPRYMKG